MLLAVDVRPATTSLGAFDGAELLRSWRVTTAEHRTADDHGLLLRALLSELGPDRPEVSGVVLGTVVPGVAPALREAVTSRFPGAPCVVVGPGVKTGLAVRTDDPREVGVDRVVNALAALALHGAPCVVVDLGSVTTVDALSASGEHVGGAIGPGLDLVADALHLHAPGLRRVELARPRHAIGRTTVEALQAGVVYGAAGQVDGVVDRVVDELGGDAVVVATGPHAPLVLAESRTVDVHEPHLTLQGLRLVFERNSTPPRRPDGRPDRSTR